MPPKSYFDKKIVIDTSVILYDALALQSFPKTDIHIPLCVIEEVDRFKRDLGEKGRNARHFSRFMDTLRNRGSLTEGVSLETGAYAFVSMESSSEDLLPIKGLQQGKADHLILATALGLKRQFSKATVELISKDINLRVKADVFGVKCRDYDPDRVASVEEIYTGVRTLSVASDILNSFFQEGSCHLPKTKLHTNQYVILKEQDKMALGRYDRKKDRIVSLIQPLTAPTWRVHPRNPEQSFAFDALLNDDIEFVSLAGKAGTGKTLLALTAGLHKTMDEGRYQRLLVSRPIVASELLEIRFQEGISFRLFFKDFSKGSLKKGRCLTDKLREQAV